MGWADGLPGRTVSLQPNTALKKETLVSQIAAGSGRYFGVQCMEQHCGKALNTCLMEADKSLDPDFNKDKQVMQQSQCGVTLLCLWHEESDEEDLEKQDHIPNKLSPTAVKALALARAARRERGADVCTDGITAAEESPVENSLLKCAKDFGCERIVSHDPAEVAASKEIPSDDAVVQDTSLLSNMPSLEKAKVSIQSILPTCLRDHCSAELSACDTNPECNSVFSCLEINSARHDKADAKKCTDKLMGLDEIKRNLIACAETAHCLEGKISPSLNIEDDIDSIPGKPRSLLQLSGGDVDDVKQQPMNEEVEKQKEDGKKPEVTEANSAEYPSKANGTAIAAASSSSFMEGAIPDFLQPLRDVARNAQRFAEEMKKKEEDLDAVANGKSASPGLSFIQEEMNADGERTDEKNIVKTPDVLNNSRDDSRKQAHGEGLSLLEGASRSGDWEADLDRQVRQWRSFLASDSRRGRQSKANDDDDDDDSSSSFLQIADKADAQGDWVTKIEKYMREDRQRVLAAARDPKPKSSSSGPDYDDDEGDGVASFLESSMSAADVRSAIRKEAEKARDIIKALQQVQKVLVGQATDPKTKGRFSIEQGRPHHSEKVGGPEDKSAKDTRKTSGPVATEAASGPHIEREAVQADGHVRTVDLKSDKMVEPKMISNNTGASFLELRAQSRAHEALEKLRAKIDADMTKNAEKEDQIVQEMKDSGGSQSLIEEAKGEVLEALHCLTPPTWAQASLPVSLTRAMARLDALAKRLSKETSA
ncbi:hypothetical protein Pmar_PMAR003575 [Perkinsus marinus ATCC 50983]|uniref:Uncharacterized protein n=1 Tax=Perkinsus marinus (strain ATCC 50983 / TXsc) TaxID=423536 RepID=C5KHQ0_PERM5|nr:hypothetical protein Pmar_PMAR003575 [Perkinsus marinus ATCC 50983]EER16112.1 hypothetical protein Pmar_PMAR003575 [Perkinsus marinus ATCC 50983]|eukprot:XP_002784316.1 hypothetical protein Pmar_PMAR003575 [Perkinsus marinus ATCC 50983]